MECPTYDKDPDARLDYAWDWTAWLGEDVITNASISVSGGIVLDDQSHTDTHVTMWLSGGTIGTMSFATCRITTLGGRTDDRTMSFKIVGK